MCCKIFAMEVFLVAPDRFTWLRWDESMDNSFRLENESDSILTLDALNIFSNDGLLAILVRTRSMVVKVVLWNERAARHSGISFTKQCTFTFLINRQRRRIRMMNKYRWIIGLVIIKYLSHWDFSYTSDYCKSIYYSPTCRAIPIDTYLKCFITIPKFNTDIRV